MTEPATGDQREEGAHVQVQVSGGSAPTVLERAAGRQTDGGAGCALWERACGGGVGSVRGRFVAGGRVGGG